MRRPVLGWVVAAFAVLPGCGGGGGGGSGGGGGTGSLAAKVSYSADDIRHLLSRTHFGGTPAEEAAAASMGVPAFVDAMLSPPAEPALDAEAKKLLWNKDDEEALKGQFPYWDAVARWWLHRMIHTTHPFREELALFWHDHFASSTAALDPSQLRWMVDQIDMLRAQGTGNLRTLLLSIARDPMMLRFLDGVLNSAEAPNENFAREFWELFTLGVDNGYTQADIVEAARAFTGYRTRYDGMTGLQFVEFDPDLHDPDPKSFLGGTVPAQNTGDDYAAVVDLTLANRPVAEFVVKRLFEHFARRSPDAALVAELAAALRADGYELKPFLRTLFLSEAFYADASKAGLVRTPVQQAVGFVRQTGLVPWDDIQDWEHPQGTPNTLRSLDSALQQAAQRVTQPPSVNGWPQDRQWLSAQGVLDRVNCVVEATADRGDQADQGMDPLTLVPNGADAAAAADALASVLNVRPTAAQRALYVQFLDSYVDYTDTEFADPFAGADAEERRSRVRGLLWVLSQHPTFFVR